MGTKQEHVVRLPDNQKHVRIALAPETGRSRSGIRAPKAPVKNLLWNPPNFSAALLIWLTGAVRKKKGINIKKGIGKKISFNTMVIITTSDF